MSKLTTFRFYATPGFTFNFEAVDYASALKGAAEFGVTADTEYKVIAPLQTDVSANDWQDHLAIAERE